MPSPLALHLFIGTHPCPDRMQGRQDVSVAPYGCSGARVGVSQRGALEPLLSATASSPARWLTRGSSSRPVPQGFEDEKGQCSLIKLQG